MLGSAVATMTESIMTTTSHIARPAKTASMLRSGRRFVWSVSLKLELTGETAISEATVSNRGREGALLVALFRGAE